MKMVRTSSYSFAGGLCARSFECHCRSRESRRKPDWSDWRLMSEMFQLIGTRWEVSVDLFAASWNAQLPRSSSLTLKPGAWRVNALSFSWKNLNGYAFPPFLLIKNCLSKVTREGSSLVLVCPIWQSQSWFPLLLELACEIPIIVPSCPNLLLSCLGEHHPLCLTSSFQRSVWKLSGIAIEASVPEKAIKLITAGTRETTLSSSQGSWNI